MNNTPTQQDFEEWKATLHLQNWPTSNPPKNEAQTAWVYLCDLFGHDELYNDKCCADESRCRFQKEIRECRLRRPPKRRKIVERIDTLVQEFKANGYSFQKPDRVIMVLEDLQ